MPHHKNTINAFPAGEVALQIQGAVGPLELVTCLPAGTIKPIVGIVCHPHPLFGGTLHNKVVTTVARAFRELGLASIRFNFRGVGASAGNYDEGRGEVDDLLAVLAWARQVRPDAAIWLAGFSFGAFVAAQAVARWPVQRLICLAPPVVNFDFTPLPAFNCPCIVVQGDADEVVAASTVLDWANTLHPAPQLMQLAGASHFFHGQLITLRQHLVSALQAAAAC